MKKKTSWGGRVESLWQKKWAGREGGKWVPGSWNCKWTAMKVRGECSTPGEVQGFQDEVWAVKEVGDEAGDTGRERMV
jgi:hypothetical protein